MPPSNYDTRSTLSFQENLNRLKPGMAFVVMIFGALLAFEVFNYTTTDHALGDLLGSLTFAGIQWSTILALAFCGIDFAGIARLFTPEQGADEPKEVWYLFGAWLLAATMNAILTWWGVSMAVSNHTVQSSTVIDPKTITTVVPVFVAIMVWVIRILIIGTLSLAMDRLMHPGMEQRTAVQSAMSASRANRSAPVYPTHSMNVPASMGNSSVPARPAVSSRQASASPRSGRSFSTINDSNEHIPEGAGRAVHQDPTYHSLSLSQARNPAAQNGNGSSGPNRYRQA